MQIKTVLATGVLGLSAAAPAFAQSSVQIYGIVDAAVRHTNNEGSAGSNRGTVTQLMGGGMSQSRWGINVTEDMGGGLKALANLENRFGADTGLPTTPYFQQSWVGLQSASFGRITLGRQYNVLFDLVTSTYASYPYSPYFDAYKPEIGFALGARADNMAKYLIEVGPFRGALQASAAERSPTGGMTRGGYLRYAQGPIAAGVGYQNYQFGSGRKIEAWTLGGSYRVGPWYFNTGYGQNKVDAGLTATDRAVLSAFWGGGMNGGFGGPAFLAADKREIAKLGVGYQVTPQLNLGAHYFYARQSGPTSNADGRARFLTAAADYAFSKRTDVYIEADATRLSGDVSLNGANGAANGAKSRNGYTVGVRHRF
ncbi:porin [uncultured Xylophilus sp.]|uniref:porin n=1 Tax=uncultured Xylophilus sp. TaxID=296832 RepID=UPI0025D4A60D|nr:porin [uncultured Xylophilus sp.]